MFIFFINDVFYSFWQNKVGQEFFDLTVRGLSLNASEVSLNHYQGLTAIPEYFIFDENKNLIIQEKVITVEDGIESTEMVTVQTIPAVVFAVNGAKVQLC